MIGKLIGGLCGMLIGGPIGLIIGVWLGHRFDRSLRMILRNFQNHGFQFNAYTHHSPAQQVFFETTFEVMGHITKVDGRVSESEIAVANQVMQRLGIVGDQRRQAIEAFARGKAAEFQLEPALLRLRQSCGGQLALLMIFLEVQMQAASADGKPSRKQQAVLDKICQAFGVSGMGGGYQHGFGGGQQQYRAGGPQQRAQGMSREQACQTLGVTSAASQQEIKKAYRKKIGENHPDRLIAKGLPEEMIKVANQKTQQIKAAYELLREQ